jgi:TetR/AcrR family transcriptional regulator, tetracycline repressor protein
LSAKLMTPRPRGRPNAVERDDLLDATLRIIDSEGTDAVTMRRLATELGVSPMAAYRHVSSKDELLRLAAAAVVRGMPAPAPGTSWPDALQAFFEIFHDRLLEHPGVARLFGGQTFLSETVYAVSDPVFQTLLDAGFDPDTAVSLFMACASTSIGSALLEAAAAEHAEEPGDTMILISAAKYPAIAAVAGYLPSRQSPQKHSQALRALIAGYRTRRSDHAKGTPCPY